MKKINKILLFIIICLTFNIKALASSEELVITGGELGVDYTYEDGIVSINKSNSYEISMADGVEESRHQININYSDNLQNLTLILNNVNLKTDDVYNIKINYPNSFEDNLKINLILKGNNSLIAKNHPYNNTRNIGELTISSDGGTLTTEATAPPEGYNSFNSSKIIFESGDVTVKNQMITTTTGIYIKGGNLNVSGQEENLYTNGEIVISGGNTTLSSTSACSINMVGKNKPVDNNILKIIGDANLNITTKQTDSASIFSGTLGKSDILIDTTGKVNINSEYIGILLNKNGNMTINNGTLNINGPYYGIYTNGGSANSTVTINGGETEITSLSSAFVLSNATQKKVIFGDQYYHKNYHGTEMASRTEVDDESLLNSNARANKYALITPAYNIEYDLGNGSLEEGKENPTKYTRVDAFTLNNPIPNNESEIFAGWSGTDLDNITKDITIENNTGNRSYIAHYVKHVDRVEATCEEDGNVEYYYDETNNKYYTDETLQNEIAETDIVLPATGHDWGEWVVTKEPTATETGLMVRKCKNDPDHVETEIIPALNPDAENREADGNPKTSFIGNVINNLKTNHNNILYIVLSILGVAGIGYTVKIIKENR